ncbi:MAG: pH regulation protein F [Gammaproteobacteria bacterium]|nr:pH regulation protein F [Gammaproteobacteria bacterium]
MQTLNLAVALFLLLNLGAGMWRVVSGPTAADRMLAAQLFGTTAVAMLLLLAESTATAVLRDVALLFSLLAAVTAVAFVQRVRPDREPDHHHAD